MNRIVFVAVFSLLSLPAQAGLFKDHWVPADGSCDQADAQVQEQVNADLRSCRDEAVVVDITGFERVDTRRLNACMDHRGWDKVRSHEAVVQSWYCAMVRAETETDEGERTESAVASTTAD